MEVDVKFLFIIFSIYSSVLEVVFFGKLRVIGKLVKYGFWLIFLIVIIIIQVLNSLFELVICMVMLNVEVMVILMFIVNDIIFVVVLMMKLGLLVIV